MATLSGAMKLRDYLSRHELTAADFGRRVGVTRSTVLRWANGDRMPESASMRAIVEATGGDVQPNDFFPAPPVAALAAAPASAP